MLKFEDWELIPVKVVVVSNKKKERDISITFTTNGKPIQTMYFDTSLEKKAKETIGLELTEDITILMQVSIISNVKKKRDVLITFITNWDDYQNGIEEIDTIYLDDLRIKQKKEMTLLMSFEWYY